MAAERVFRDAGVVGHAGWLLYDRWPFHRKRLAGRRRLQDGAVDLAQGVRHRSALLDRASDASFWGEDDRRPAGDGQRHAELDSWCEYRHLQLGQWQPAEDWQRILRPADVAGVAQAILGG